MPWSFWLGTQGIKVSILGGGVAPGFSLLIHATEDALAQDDPDQKLDAPMSGGELRVAEWLRPTSKGLQKKAQCPGPITLVEKR